jgi:hypothetical protein
MNVTASDGLAVSKIHYKRPLFISSSVPYFEVEVEQFISSFMTLKGKKKKIMFVPKIAPTHSESEILVCFHSSRCVMDHKAQSIIYTEQIICLIKTLPDVIQLGHRGSSCFCLLG